MAGLPPAIGALVAGAQQKKRMAATGAGMTDGLRARLGRHEIAHDRTFEMDSWLAPAMRLPKLMRRSNPSLRISA